MAGRRRTRTARDADGTVPLTAAERRAREIEMKMRTRHAEASTAARRLAALCDYVRSAAVLAARTDPAWAEHTVDEAARRLAGTGAELLKMGQRRGHRR
jgi:hypothetical protein